MLLRLGLGIRAQCVAAVLTEGRTIRAHAIVERVRDQPLSVPLRESLARLELRSKWRPPVIAAVGPSASHVKVLSGLPATRKPALLNQGVRENVDRHFLRGPTGWYVSELHRVGEAWWGAVVDRNTVDVLRAVCAELHLPFVGCLPTVAVLGKAFHDGTLIWEDGDAQLAVALERAECVALTHAPPSQTQRQSMPAQRYITPAGTEGLAIADAYAASQHRKRAALIVSGGLARKPSRVRRAMLGVLVVLSAIAAIVAPNVALLRQGGTARNRLAGLADSATRFQATEAALRAVSGELNEIASFAASRRSNTLLLGAISQVLPESTAIVSLHTDTLGGTIVFVSRDAAGVVPGLYSVDGLTSPEFLGALTGEVLEGANVQRGAVRFRYPGAARSASVGAPKPEQR